MNLKFNFQLLLGAIVCIAAASPASADTVYKCRSKSGVTYSERPCPQRTSSASTVNTEQAPVAVKPNPKQVEVRRAEEARVLAQTMHQQPGESADQFATRRRRARLMAEDRDECARLDTRMPVEESGLSNPDKTEVMKSEAALAKSRKRFGELGC